MIASVLLAVTAATLAPGFRYRLDAADAPRRAEPGRYPANGVPLLLRTSEPDRTRLDLLVLTDRHLPRWKWNDAGFVSSGRLTLRAPAGSTALLVLRDDRRPGYRLDGPFVWPVESGEREIVARGARAVSGSSLLAREALALVGTPAGAGPLCEEEDGGDWQCIGLPPGFSGRLVTCREGVITGAAEVEPGSPAEVSIRELAAAALLRLDLPEPLAPPAPNSVRVLSPGAGDFAVRSDPRWTVRRVDGIHVWIETPEAPPYGPIEVSAAGYVAKRIAIDAEPRCAEPFPVSLARAVALRGTVTDPDGMPVAGALLLARSNMPGGKGPVLGDAQTDSDGQFEIPGLEPVSHRVRACHGEHGCGEEPAVPGIPVVVRLPGRGAFIGRVLSGGGAPEPGAVIRILPTAESWATAEDRLTRLPLESRSGSDGRFRISAAENGDFLVEVRGESAGVARFAVQRSVLSPAVTDLGDVRLPEAVQFTARVPGCAAGILFLSGPLGGETSLPDAARFRLDDTGLAAVRLPEGGTWAAWASCGGRPTWIEPALLPDAAGLSGLEIRFERAPEGAGSGKP
jgi:hypothetical protein